jgi:hypothetical protein
VPKDKRADAGLRLAREPREPADAATRREVARAAMRRVAAVRRAVRVVVPGKDAASQARAVPVARRATAAAAPVPAEQPRPVMAAACRSRVERVRRC